LQKALLNGESCGAACLKEGALRFDHGDERRHEVDNSRAEFLEGGCRRLQASRPVARADFPRQGVPARIKTHAQGILLGTNGCDKAIGEMHHAWHLTP
jgi:hypothetical protein